MTRGEKIKAIYEEIANKERKFGCRCKTRNWANVIFIRKNRKWEYLYIRRNNEFMIPLWYAPEIIWHPVMIGDVIDWIEPYWALFAQSLNLSNERQRKIKFVLVQWHKKREPIEMQSDECIDYVYSLIPKS